MNGFLDGRGGSGDPSGSVAGTPEDEPDMNEAKADGVNAVASAGGGRPASFAKRVLSHRINVNMPRTDPSVFRRLPNCSATETMAEKGVSIRPQMLG